MEKVLAALKNPMHEASRNGSIDSQFHANVDIDGITRHFLKVLRRTMALAPLKTKTLLIARLAPSLTSCS